MATQQSSKYILPVEVAEKLNCSYCQGYLSCGPIKMQENTYICGRCTTKKGVEVILQPLFEHAMAQFKFPCKFDKKGCLQQIPFNYSQKHEATCLYRTLSCPALNCTVEISASKVYQHFQSRHSKCIIENGQFELELLRSQNQHLLIYESDCIVIVKYCFSVETKLMQFSVVPIVEKNRQLNKYKLQIINGTDLDSSVNLSPKTCHTNNSSILLVGEHDEYNMHDCLSILNDPSFVIINVSLLFIDSTSNFDENKINCETEVVKETNEISERIAQEAFRERICDNCKKSCLFCSCKDYSQVSDITCQWRGCNEIGNRNKMLKHVDECKFKLYVCPFLEDCEESLFKLNSSFISHLETHAQRCPNAEEIIIPLFNANVHYNKEKVHKYFTVLNNTIVRFTCTVGPSSNWTLVCTCPININVIAYFSHEHCRSVIKVPQKCAKKIRYRNSDISSSDCFVEFPRLKAVLKIDIDTKKGPLDQTLSNSLSIPEMHYLSYSPRVSVSLIHPCNQVQRFNKISDNKFHNNV